MASFKKQATFINKFIYEPIDGNWNFISHLYLSSWPTYFFGIGNEWDENIYDIYTSKNIRLPITLGTDLFMPKSWQGKFNYGIEFDAEYITFDYENTENTELKNYKDLRNSGRLGIGYNLTYNSSEKNDWPRRGSFVQIRHIFFNSKDNDFAHKKSFIWKNIDTRMYIPMPFLPEGVLALGSYLEDFDGDVPFDRLAQPDGVGQLRGLKKGFLSDKTSWVLQSELRTHLFWRCKGTLFYELAKVGNGFADLNDNKWHSSIGIGGRFLVNRESKTHIRGDLSLIDKKYLGMAVKINEAF
jgi:outer membrane protein assembly factor BamA